MKRQAVVDPEEFRWEPAEGVGDKAGSDAPVLALLALTGTLVVAREDGAVAAVPVAAGPGPLVGAARELCRSAVPVSALAWGFGEVLGAAGDRIVRLGPDGSLRDGPAFDATVGALCTRAGKVFAVAGDAVYTLDRQGDGWEVTRSTPLPFDGCHDLDVDRRGRYALVCRRPRDGVVVDLETGAKVGSLGPSRHSGKVISEICGRFSPVADNVYRFASRAHTVDKLARLAKSGRSLGYRHDLEQPSTWCTPVSSSPDGRHVASRQSGVGVLVWDLATELQELFAELDDADPDDKFARLARRAPAAVRPLGDGITVTRWAHLPVPDGDTTAVAVAPGARYAAVGGADGSLTVIDGATRRIEHGDGTVRQPPPLAERLTVGPASQHVFDGGRWVGLTREGEVTVVDLATSRTHTPGVLDLTGLTGLDLKVDGDVLVLTYAGGARGHDLGTLAEVWRADAALAGCGGPRYSGGLLLAPTEPDEGPPALRRYDPRTGTFAPDLPMTCEEGSFTPVAPIHDAATGDVVVSGECAWPRGERRHRFPGGTGPGEHLDAFTGLVSGSGVSVTSQDDGFAVRSLAAPDTVLAVLPDGGLGLRIPDFHVDLARGLAVGQDLGGRRFALWRLDGSPPRLYDGIGEIWATGHAFTDDALWLYSGRQSRLYRLVLPA